MRSMMEAMGLLMLVGLLFVAAVLAGAIYLGVRAGLAGRRPADDPQAALDPRFANGDIDADEYHERASALRSLRAAQQH